jgi:isoleucyl-tRNA synthetase
LFRLVREWYIRTEDIRPKLLEAASKVKWEPEYIGKRMQDWLANMGDWNISRKRFYGLPLPFYPCEHCGTLTVIGSKEELYELGGAAAKELPELHRPWIDQVTLQCPSCGSRISRISEVGDVWLDAGIVPFSTLGYFSDRKLWEKYYPAEWVIEMREQVRLWFYSLLFMSVTLEGRAPYERVLAHGSVVAEDGTRFSKTGFMIQFDTAAEKLGSDTIRYLFAGAGMANDVRFGYNLGEEARRKILSFWNICVFFMTYAVLEKPELMKKPSPEALETTDRWVLARTNQFIREISGFYEAYKTPELIKAFEVYVEDVSKWYVRTNRKRFWKQEQSENKQAAYWCLYQALKATVQVMAPVIPFSTEYLWQHMVRFLENDCEESVHLSCWPSVINVGDESNILVQTELVRNVIGIALKIRNENQLKVKQPLSCMVVVAGQRLLDLQLVFIGIALKIRNENQLKVKQPLSCMVVVAEKDKQEIVRQMLEIVQEELNVKSVVFMDDESSLHRKYLTLNLKKAGSVLKDKVQVLLKLLDKVSAEDMEVMVTLFQQGGSVKVPGLTEPVPCELFTESARCKSNIALARDKGVTVALDISLTEELIQEGFYRELLRNCQLLRKEAGLRVDQRIRLSISHGDRSLGSILSTNHGERPLGSMDENHLQVSDSFTIIRDEGFDVELQKAQAEEGYVPNRLQAVLEKYGKAIAEETLASLVDEISDPVIVKEITVGEHAVVVKIGLA